MSRLALLAVLAAGLLQPGTAAADETEDRIAFNTHCRNCHSATKDDHRLGPSMYGIVGAEAGQITAYRAYSGGLKGFIWDEATLDRFIANPTSVSSTTSMIYPPVGDPAERQKIIRFLKSLDGR